MTRCKLEDLVESTGVRFGTSGARGLVRDMTDDLCYAYTAAFLQAVNPRDREIVLGHDLRPSSPRITAACGAAIRDGGFTPVYVGALPTPAVAFYAGLIGAPALVITGSHIPFDRNGIKFYRVEGEITKGDEASMLSAVVDVQKAGEPWELPPPDCSARQAYIDRYLDFFGRDALRGVRVAVYEHSGVARDLLRDILEAMGCEVLGLGRTEHFVPIDTEAVSPEDIARARNWARQHRFDAIFSTDGDADRPLVGDEKGRWLRGDIVGLLCANYLGVDRVVVPVSCNTALEKSGLFKEVIRTRIGSPYVIAGMKQFPANDRVAGFEANGGFLLGGDVLRRGSRLQALPTRDAVLPILAILCLACQRQCPVSALTENLPPRFTASDRIGNVPVNSSRRLLASLANAGQDMTVLVPDAGSVVAVDDTDGLRMTFSTGNIVHLRPSGNAPELRCYAEADRAERAEELCAGCLRRVSAMMAEEAANRGK